MVVRVTLGFLLTTSAMLSACDAARDAPIESAPSQAARQQVAASPDPLDLIRSEIRDEEAMGEDTASTPPSYEVGIATAAANREQRLAACEEKPAPERAVCNAEANAEWDTRRGEIEPSRSSGE